MLPTGVKKKTISRTAAIIPTMTLAHPSFFYSLVDEAH
jgi:hypothetical protein